MSLAWRAFQFKLDLTQAILFQSVLTLALTRWLKLAWWWCLIQPLFPLAIAVTLLLPVPAYVYLLLFLFFLVFYWSTYRTQVPYYPSNKNVWLALEQLLPQDRPISFIDIGSGLGGLVLYLGTKYGAGRFTGVEIAPLPWLLSYLRLLMQARGRSGNTAFLRLNYEALNFSEYDVVFAYLSPAAMDALWKKAKREMRPGSILISYEFPFGEVDANLAGHLENRQEIQTINGRNLYIRTL
ncbi:SAM-dependent methyltransferase [Oxalobacteraceae bacterium GrIS 2.11]